MAGFYTAALSKSQALHWPGLSPPSTACFAVYYIATAFALGYGTTALKIHREIFLAIQLGAIMFMALSIVIAGWWSDRSSPTRVLAWGCAGTLVMGIVFGPLIGTAALLPIFVALSLALFVMGVTSRFVRQTTIWQT